MKRNTKTVVWLVSQVVMSVILTSLLFLSSGCNRNCSRNLHILVTNDVHGSWFDSTYVDGKIHTSLVSANTYIDSVRNAVGAENVILIDAGDCLQGDNAPYYFNYVAVDEPHLFPRIAARMGYDAVVVGNHDIETGHAVYDRVAAQLRKAGIPWLASNAVKTSDGTPYFQEYTVVKRAGLKVLIIGFTNPNISAWLSNDLWSGMEFRSLLPYVQQRVDAIRSRVKPDITVVAVHSGTGEGDGSQYESQGLDLFESLSDVDVLICAHDHKATTRNGENIVLMNSGSHCRNLGHVVIEAEVEHGKIASKQMFTELIKLDKDVVDVDMRESFRPEFEAVRQFTGRVVGATDFDIRTRDSYAGRATYTDFIHTVQLSVSGSRISFAAPLAYNAFIPSGEIKYNDLFTIYPYENQLYVVSLTGAEIKDYLEKDYDKWICNEPDHVLRIQPKDDARTAASGWSFVNRSYNFDSAAGLNYTVDITREVGDRINITTLADGSKFSSDSTYSVAVSSYRCNYCGWDDKVIRRYPELRELIYRHFQENQEVSASEIQDTGILGDWRFVPERIAIKAIERDMDLLFRK